MKFSSHHHITSIFLVFVLFFLSFMPVFPTKADYTDFRLNNQNFRPDNESEKMNLIKAHLMKINKPFVKSIKSPDGDIIDCVLIHLQPAFDHPKLKGTMSSDPPVTPKWEKAGIESEIKQIWNSRGELCPNGTIPIRRISEHDIFRSISISKFGKKFGAKSSDDGRAERAMVYVKGEKYYGGQASLNVWNPKVTDQNEFSMSQIWIAANTSAYDLNSIQAGWQVNPVVYGDDFPRLFIYWTSDGYNQSGCFDLLCSGFVQTNSKIALGGAIQPISTYNSREQYEISITIAKDQKHGKWWLRVGSSLMGYWPESLFPNLQDDATFVGFGGEVFNYQTSGRSHTSTQMGSGHFSVEGYGKAAYIKNMTVVDEVSTLKPVSGVKLLADRPKCYDVGSGFGKAVGNFIFFGGPGKNPECP